MRKCVFMVLFFIGAVGPMGCTLFSGEDIPKNVVWVFTMNGCTPCKDAIKYLTSKDVEFQEFNINQSDENLKLFRKYRGRNMPLIFISGERIEGFDESLLEIAVNALFEFENVDPKKVIMYSRANCGWCVKAHDFFKANNIVFSEYFIDASPEHYKRFQELRGQGTPLILIGPNRISGFNEKAIRMALKQAGLM